MQILITVAMAAVAAIQTPSIPHRPVRSESVLVRSVIDGNTIEVATVGRVRLLGVDAPRIGRGFDAAAPFARAARERLTQLVLHRWVRLEQEGARRDASNRHLAYVMTEDGLCVNAALVRDGLARVSVRLPLTRMPELQRAEADARAFRRGMWGIAPQIPAPSYTGRSKASRPPRPDPTRRRRSAAKRAQKKP